MPLRRAGKEKVAAKRGDDGSSREEASGLVRFWTMAVAGIALVLLLATAIATVVWIEKDASDSRRKLESCVGMLVRDLANRAASLQAQLRALSADADLREVLRHGDAKGLLAAEERLARLIPNASRVRLIGRSDANAEVPDTQTLSYAGLDLINQVERERSVTVLEVHRLGQKDMHLAIAGPVLDAEGRQVLGVVHVALPLSVLPSTGEVAGEQVSIVLQQHVGKEGAQVDPDTRGSMPEREPDYSAGVPATRLRVVAWNSRSGFLEGGVLWYALGAYAALLALCAAVLWLPVRGMKRALVADYGAVIDVLTDGLNRRPVREVRCQLAETRPMINVISQMLHGIGQLGAAEAVVGSAQVAGRRSVPMEVSGAVPGKAARGVPIGREDVGVRPAYAPPAAPSAHGGVPAGTPRHDVRGRGAAPVQGEEGVVLPGSRTNVPERVFRAYDIRGIVGRDLTVELARYVGLALGSALGEGSEPRVTVARDTRPSGTELCEALVHGLRETGCEVIDLGVGPTPLLYFATRYRSDTSGVMVTGSHNPAEYNGLKVVVDGIALEGERLAALRERIESGDFVQGEGGYQTGDLAPVYIQNVVSDVAIARSMKVVLDCGNGAASVLAPDLYRALHCEVIELSCDPSAGFPDGCVPDPSRPECLAALQQRVVQEEADLGLAFDGDGDRLGVVDSSGKVIWTDRVLMLLAADVLSRNPGTDVVFDVKCSRHLADEILRNGGRPVMSRSGHSPLKNKLRETGALLGGEWSGHILFAERWYGFDDALYAGARLLEILALDPRSTTEVFASLPEALSTPELILPLADEEAELIMHTVLAVAERMEGVDVQTVDGLRANMKRGWGLVRASNTRPALTFRFEADDASAMEGLKDLFRDIMSRAAPGLELPF